MLIQLICHQCNEEFSVFPYRRSTANFCSRNCSYKSKRGNKHALGYRHSREARKKMSKTWFKKGGHPGIEFKKGQVPWIKNRGHTEETKIRLSVMNKGGNRGSFKKGEEHLFWNNGNSFEPYGIEFNEGLKEKVRKRDNHRCQECFRHEDELFTKLGKKRKLSVHHVDYNKNNSDIKNLISLCTSCHSQTNFGREDWTDYFNERIISQWQN